MSVNDELCTPVRSSRAKAQKALSSDCHQPCLILTTWSHCHCDHSHICQHQVFCPCRVPQLHSVALTGVAAVPVVIAITQKSAQHTIKAWAIQHHLLVTFMHAINTVLCNLCKAALRKQTVSSLLR